MNAERTEGYDQLGKAFDSHQAHSDCVCVCSDQDCICIVRRLVHIINCSIFDFVHRTANRII